VVLPGTKNAAMVAAIFLAFLVGIGLVHEVLTVSKLPSIKELYLVGKNPGEPDSRLPCGVWVV
jgi:hypothetical protein